MKDKKVIVSYKVIITFIDYILNNYLQLIGKRKNTQILKNSIFTTFFLINFYFDEKLIK